MKIATKTQFNCLKNDDYCNALFMLSSSCENINVFLNVYYYGWGAEQFFSKFSSAVDALCKTIK